MFVHWIETDPATRRFLGHVLTAAGAVASLFMAGMLVTTLGGEGAEAGAAGWQPLFWPLAIAMLSMSGWGLLRRFGRYRIGTDGHVLYLMEPNGILRSLSLSNVRYTPHRIWVGSRWMTYRTPIGELFRRQELRRYVFSLLPASARMNEWDAMREVAQIALLQYPWMRWALPLGSVLLIGMVFVR